MHLQMRMAMEWSDGDGGEQSSAPAPGFLFSLRHKTIIGILLLGIQKRYFEIKMREVVVYIFRDKKNSHRSKGFSKNKRKNLDNENVKVQNIIDV